VTETLELADDRERSRLALEATVAAGGVALFPADTVYALGCDPLSESAIARIHELKGRDDGKPSAVMFFSPLAMRELVAALGPRTREAMGALMPGPVTLVVANPEHRYRLACRQDPERLGLRLIGGPLEGTRCAVFQTSANRSGEPAPHRFADIDASIIAGVDLVIDGGELGGEPSTVVDVGAVEEGGDWTILRQGALPADQVAAQLDPLR
jgi:L-threonylcarbamoyladenylate synthase